MLKKILLGVFWIGFLNVTNCEVKVSNKIDNFSLLTKKTVFNLFVAGKHYAKCTYNVAKKGAWGATQGSYWTAKNGFKVYSVLSLAYIFGGIKNKDNYAIDEDPKYRVLGEVIFNPYSWFNVNHFSENRY